MKYNKISGFCCGIFLLLSFTDEPIETSMSSILATAKTNAQLTYNQQIPHLINGLNYKLPLLRKLEFKIGSDNFDLTGQQFGIAVSPNTFGQMKRHEAMKKIEINRVEAENNVFIQDALFERYQALVDARFAMELKIKEKALETLLTQKNATLKSMIQQGLDVKIKDIADTENDRYGVQLALLQLETNVAGNDEKLRQFMGSSKDIFIIFKNVVRVNDMEKMVKDIKNTQLLQTPDMLLAKAEKDAKRASFDLENASNKEILSSIQVVDAPKKGEPFNNFGVRFTLSVPLVGNSRLKRNELLIDLKKAENKENLLSINNQNAIKYQIVKIENLIKKYRIYADKVENSLIKNLLANARLTAEMNATELLDLKITQQKTEIELDKIEYNIMSEYVILLNNTSLLGAIPLKNYLSIGLEVF